MSDKTKGLYTGDSDFDELLDKCMRIMKTKAVDYAEKDDRLAEFRQTAGMVGVDMKTVLGIYMNKHLRSLYKWLKGDELKGEPIEEKLTDIIIYCLLAYKIAKEGRESPDKPITVNEAKGFGDIVGTDIRAALCLCDYCGREMTAIYDDRISDTYEVWKAKLKTNRLMCDICREQGLAETGA